MKYLMSDEYSDGRSTSDDGRTVDQEHVDRFIHADTLAFFVGLGGTEEVVREADGVIRVTSTSPDKTVVRKVVFTPVHGA